MNQAENRRQKRDTRDNRSQKLIRQILCQRYSPTASSSNFVRSNKDIADLMINEPYDKKFEEGKSIN